MDCSLHLLAIQSLNGQNPGDKYKNLHSIATQIIKNDKEREEFISTGFTEYVQPALLPHLRIIVGNKLKLNNAVIEALKSEDLLIIRQALNAKWFYNSSNEIIHVDYFVTNVIPYISLRTRLELVKTLAHSLVGDSRKANDFFSSFADLFSVEQALPLIIACSETYIYEEILKRRINLPSRILSILYRRYPNLVIRYLHLGNEKNKINKKDRKIHSISLSNYSSFLPMLVKHHTQEFVELFECSLNYSKNMKLGSTRAEFFLRNATDVLIKKPRLFLKLLPLKLVSNKLSTQQFETMFENLFLKNVKEFAIEQMIDYLQYYPQEKQFSLLINKYKLLYGQDLLENLNVFNCEKFWKILPTEIKEEYGKKKLESYVRQRQYLYIFYLPPNESIKLLKERMFIPSDVSRSVWLCEMLKSCAIYNSKKCLLDVLNYYYTRHINEQSYVLHEVLNCLISVFDIKTLNSAHWKVLQQIIRTAYNKGDLFSLSYNYAQFFKDTLHYFLKQDKFDPLLENTEFLDLFIKIIIECYVEHHMKWKFITDCPEFERVCLQKFLTIIPEKYPETYKIWDKNKIKLIITTYLIKSMHNFNIRHFFTESNKRYNTGIMDSSNKEIKKLKFAIENYSWLMKFASELMNMETNISSDVKEFKKILRSHDIEFYQHLIDNNCNLINDIESSDAIVALKHNQNKILNKWNLYLEICKEKLQLGSKSAKRFILMTRWYQEIPITFMKQCFRDLEGKNNILILGILLEGEAFDNLIKSYLSRDSKTIDECIDNKSRYDIISSLAKAINFTNPPVSFNTIDLFCQKNYTLLVTNTLLNIARRVPVNNVIAYANQLINKSISIKKLGIRMIFQVATKSELQEFLIRMWQIEMNLSIRELLANKVYNVFQASPNNETWILMKACFDGITCNDQKILENLVNIKGIDTNFIAVYIKEFFNKLDSFNESELTEKKKKKLICFLVNKISKNVIQSLSEELVTDIVEKHFFSYSITFTVKLYLLSDVDKFENRLKVIMKILSKEVENFNKPSEKSVRYYPANHNVHIFFSSMIMQLLNQDKDQMSERVINVALEFLSTIMRPWQDPHTFIALSICKTYYEATTPKEFGINLSKNIVHLVTEFKSEIIVSKIVEVMNIFLEHANVYKEIKKMDLKLMIINGLVESDKYYGALVGIKLIHCFEISQYNNIYDQLLESWKGIENVTVRASLSELMNNVFF